MCIRNEPASLQPCARWGRPRAGQSGRAETAVSIVPSEINTDYQNVFANVYLLQTNNLPVAGLSLEIVECLVPADYWPAFCQNTGQLAGQSVQFEDKIVTGRNLRRTLRLAGERLAFAERDEFDMVESDCKL